MRVLVLGGGGFIGINLTKALLANRFDIRIFERPNRKAQSFINSEENLEWYEGDFSNQIEVEEAMQGCDAIYHLVSTTLPQNSNDNPAYDVESNVIASIKMMEAARNYGVKKIIFASSGGTVYGIPEQTPILETHPTNPICSYGISKLTIEKYLALFHANGGPNYTILRLANPYGYYQSPDSSQGVIAVFIKKALVGEQIEIWGDGTVIRDYVFIDDVVRAMVACLISSICYGVFNVGSGDGYSVNQILERIEYHTERKTNKIYLSSRKIDVPKNVLDISKMKATIGWQPIVTIDNGIKKTIEFIQQNLLDLKTV